MISFVKGKMEISLDHPVAGIPVALFFNLPHLDPFLLLILVCAYGSRDQTSICSIRV
jgi:hypothetical protein